MWPNRMQLSLVFHFTFLKTWCLGLMTWSLTSGDHGQQEENPYSNNLSLEDCWAFGSFPGWLVVSSPKVGGEQVKTKQPFHHWTESISILLHLSLKGEHFTLQEKMAGARSELVPTNHTPGPWMDTQLDHLRSQALVQLAVWRGSVPGHQS